MKRKHMFLLIAAIIIFIGVFVCLILRPFNNKPKTEIVFRITWDALSSRGEAVNKIVETYNASQNDVHVTMTGGNEERQDFLDTLDQNAADVLMMPYRYTKNSEIADGLLNLDTIYSSQKNYYYDTVNILAKTKNGAVGIPWIGHSMALIYNQTILDEAGVDPQAIQSMDDLLDACRLIALETDAGGLGLVGADCHDLSWMASQFIYSFGGALVSADSEGNQTAVLIDSPESAKALDFYIHKLGNYAQDGWQEDTGVEVMEAFADGEIAFEIQGPWGITDIWKRGKPFEVGAIALSRMGIYAEVGPLLLSIDKDTPHAEAAKAFVRYLIQKETLERVMDGEYDEKYEAFYPYRVPLRKDMEDSDFFKRYPEFLVFIEGYQKPSINTMTAEWEEAYKPLYEHYVHQAVIGEITIQEALKNIGAKKPYE